ncbi:hypothetical protein [Pendulispora albinea]|uniref:Uncharacterized protein n=1 Tax=Pendulispora albinea TaxID=2741071 RepID=A0ABZ2LQG3_9BACT
MTVLISSGALLAACSANAPPDDAVPGEDVPAAHEDVQSHETVEQKTVPLACVYQCCDFRRKQQCCPGQPCGPCALATNNCQ